MNKKQDMSNSQYSLYLNFWYSLFRWLRKQQLWPVLDAGWWSGAEWWQYFWDSDEAAASSQHASITTCEQQNNA